VLIDDISLLILKFKMEEILAELKATKKDMRKLNKAEKEIETLYGLRKEIVVDREIGLRQRGYKEHLGVHNVVKKSRAAYFS